MDQSPNLRLPYLSAAQAQKHVTHNEAIRALDALVHVSVVTRGLSAPPATPADGVRYLVGPSPTGAWTGFALHLAAFQDGAWAFFEARTGWLTWVADDAKLYVFDGTAWSVATGSSSASVNPTPLVGVNTTADAANRLAVKSPASLFDHAGAGHQLKINKAAAADTASLLFQDAYSGRAEIGLTGDDNLHVKVSADGSVWREAIRVERATGRVSFPSGGAVQTAAASVIAAVPSQFPTVQAALDSLLAYRFLGGAQGIVEIDSGTYLLPAPLVCVHPQPGRILVRAKVASTTPVAADFTGTKATDDAMIRLKYKVVLEFADINAVDLGQGEGLSLQDIAFIRSGTAGNPSAINAAFGSSVTLLRCACFGFGMGIRATSAAVSATMCQLVYSTSIQAQLQTAALFNANTVLALYGASHGFFAIENSVLSVSFCVAKGNTFSGYYADGQSVIRGFGSHAISNNAFGVQNGALASAVLLNWTFQGNASGALYQADGAKAYVLSATVTGGGLFQSWNGSHLSQIGTHTGGPTFTPASGTIGNANSYTT
jgi:Protein of unknown function (DUF2793)